MAGTTKTSATKSVLSQSASMQSGAAMALGGLMNKGSSSKRGKSADGTSNASSRDRDNDLASVAPGTSNAGSSAAGGSSVAAGVPKAKSRAGASKSVLSQATGLQSGAAMALGGMLNKPAKREKSADRENDLASVALGTSNAGSSVAQGSSVAAGGPKTKAQSRGGASKSVLSLSSGTQSGAAMALGGLLSKGGPAKRAVSADRESDPPIAAPGAQPWSTADLPTRAEEQNSKKLLASGPLLHPDDEKVTGYNDKLPQDIKVEQVGPPQPSKSSSWMCGCSSSKAPDLHVMVISEPTRHEPPTFVQNYVAQPLEGASLHCSNYASEVIREIAMT